MNREILPNEQGLDGIRGRYFDLLREVLGIEPEDLSASFYDYGGDSLLFLIFVTRVNELGNLDLTQVEISGSDALGKVLQCLEDAGRKSNDESGQNDPKNRGISVPVTANRYSYLSKMGVDAEVWSLSSQVYCLSRRPTAEELERIAFRLTARHDGLALNLWCKDGTWRQEAGEARVEVRVSQFSGELRGSPYDQFLSTEINKVRGGLGLKKSQACLLLVTSSTCDDTHFCIVFHHAFIDGISLAVIERDVLNALLNGVETLPLGPTSASYSAYAADNLMRCEQMVADACEYWKKLPWGQLVGFPYGPPNEWKKLSQQWTQTHELSFCGASFDIALQTLARKNGVSIPAVLVAALAIAYRQWAGQNFFLIDLAHHGRPTDWRAGDFSETVGWINQTVPLVIDAQGSVEQVVCNVDAQIGGAERFGRTFSYCQHLASDPVVSHQFRQYPDASISINILTAPTIGEALSRQIPIYPIDRFPKDGCRVHQISVGAVRERDHFRLAMDHNSRAIEPERVLHLLNLWGKELERSIDELCGATLISSDAPL